LFGGGEHAPAGFGGGMLLRNRMAKSDFSFQTLVSNIRSNPPSTANPDTMQTMRDGQPGGRKSLAGC
jgi:hypothetical protein